MYKLETLLKQSDQLPALPEIYIKVSELLDSNDSTAQQIGKEVQADPSLTTRILKVINSAYYGLPNQVTSISQAILLLGRNHLKQVLMGSVLGGIFKDIDQSDFSIREFWQHSIKTAIIARQLAMQNAQIIDHEAFFTAGLLHDIGRLVMIKVAGDSLVEINEQAKISDKDIVQLEAEKLGVTHIDVGEALMKKWSMPSLLTQCVVKHHETEHVGPFSIDTSMVYLANQLSHHDSPINEEETQDILATIYNWQQTECTLEQIFVACELAEEQWLEVMESLGMIG